MVAQVLHQEGAGRPSTATTDDNNERVREGIKKLVQGWKKCIEKQEDCVETLYCYKFSIFIEIKFVSVLRIIIDSPTYTNNNTEGIIAEKAGIIIRTAV